VLFLLCEIFFFLSKDDFKNKTTKQVFV